MKKLITDRIFRALFFSSLAFIIIDWILLTQIHPVALVSNQSEASDAYTVHPPSFIEIKALITALALSTAILAILRARKIFALTRNGKLRVARKSRFLRYVSWIVGVWIVLVLLVMITLYFTPGK